MRVGLTYDLKDDYLSQGLSKEECAEFDSIETIDAIDAFLQSRGCQTERIGHVKHLAHALVQGWRWDLVFNIAEGLYGRGREAQVPALLDAYRIPYIFSDPLVLSLTLDKAMTKRIVRDAGIPTASFFAIERSDNYIPESSYFPLFLKPNAEGTGKGISPLSLATDMPSYRASAQSLLAQYDSLIVEQYLPGREFTVGITGTGKDACVIGVMEIILNDKADACGYTYDNKQLYEERVRYALVADTEAQKAADVALAAWKVLGCRDGGRIDIRSDANAQPHFLEVNPLAGLHPVLGDLVILSQFAGLTYPDLLSRILDSALADPSRFVPNRQPVMTAYA